MRPEQGTDVTVASLLSFSNHILRSAKRALTTLIPASHLNKNGN